jgi:hypothetical protein
VPPFGVVPVGRITGPGLDPEPLPIEVLSLNESSYSRVAECHPLGSGRWGG